jgi:hypothetical protein
MMMENFMKLKLGKYARIIKLPMLINNNCELLSITLFGIEERNDTITRKPGGATS